MQMTRSGASQVHQRPFGGAGARLAFRGGSFAALRADHRQAPRLAIPPQRRRSPFAAWSDSVDQRPASTASTQTLASVTSTFVPTERGFSGYALRQSWKPSPGGTGWYDANSQVLSRQFRSPHDLNVGGQAPQPDTADGTVATNPWTPRLTHLRRPPPLRQAPLLPARSANSLTGSRSSLRSAGSTGSGVSSSATSLLSTTSDGSPVWPYSWNRDSQVRGKHR